MHDRGHDPDRQQGVLLVPPRRRRQRARRRRRLALAGFLILVVGVGVGTWFWYRYRDGGTEPGSEEPAVAESMPAPVDPADPSATAPPDTLDLPELGASDAFLRDVVASLSARPEWASWLVGDDLARRFVETVVRVSGGSSPASSLEPLAPEGEFRVRESDGRTVIDSASYRRYDLLTATFASLDNEGTARLYRQLHPLFEEAHRELGLPEGTFDSTVARAVENVLAVEVPEGPLEVVWEEGVYEVYEFRDPAIEARSPVAKHLLRMGPENARRIQAKVRVLAAALGIRTDPPPASSR